MVDEAGLIEFARAFRQLAEATSHLAQTTSTTTLRNAIGAHLGAAPDGLPVMEQLFPRPDHPNIQLAMEELAAESDDSQLFGLPVEVLHWSGYGITNLASPRPHAPSFEPVAPSYVNVPIGVDETLPCLNLGVWLARHDGAPVVVLVSLGDPHHGRNAGVHVEVMATDRSVGEAFLADLAARALRLNVYRGKVLSFTFDQWGTFGLEFHRLPTITRDDLILPPADLDALERHTLGIAEHADRLRAAGRHLKRGLLLYGPPGTGKTFSVQYLCSRMPGRTTLLVSGQAAPTLGQAAAIARALQPSMLVLEDVDLVAMERTMPGMQSNPLLFQLLNEMDGLDEDADIVFVLTTNRVELLEPALAARPGRVDQSIEIRLPDEECRRRLLVRYLEGVGGPDVEHASVVLRTAGVSAAFLKELVRRASLVAADRDGDGGRLVVSTEHLHAALDDMLEHATPTLRRILGADVD